jgi:hypothetical protein
MGGSSSKEEARVRNTVISKAMASCGATAASSKMSGNRIQVRAHSAAFCGKPVGDINVRLRQDSKVVEDCHIDQAVKVALDATHKAKTSTVAGIGFTKSQAKRMTEQDLKNHIEARCGDVLATQEMNSNQLTVYTCGGDTDFQQVGSAKKVCMLNSAAELTAKLRASSETETKGASLLGLAGLDANSATILFIVAAVLGVAFMAWYLDIGGSGNRQNISVHPNA